MTDDEIEVDAEQGCLPEEAEDCHEQKSSRPGLTLREVHVVVE